MECSIKKSHCSSFRTVLSSSKGSSTTSASLAMSVVHAQCGYYLSVGLISFNVSELMDAETGCIWGNTVYYYFVHVHNTCTLGRGFALGEQAAQLHWYNITHSSIDWNTSLHWSLTLDPVALAQLPLDSFSVFRSLQSKWPTQPGPWLVEYLVLKPVLQSSSACTIQCTVI